MAAATATAVILAGYSGPPPEFTVDRPFLFFILDASGIFLFAGQAVNPESPLFLLSAFSTSLRRRKWVTDYFKIQAIPISARIVALTPEVDVTHADPCDRIIIATATAKNLAVVSSDKRIRACSQVDVIW
jgi:hypothetical protein